VQETIQIEGVPIHIVDTAGLRESEDVVERIGIERTWEEIGRADAVIHLHDLAAETSLESDVATKSIAARALLMPAIRQKLPQNTPVIDVWNKADLSSSAPPGEGLLISAKTGQGLEALRHKLLEVAGWQAASGEGSYIARERHVQAIAAVQAHLELASDHLDASLKHQAAGLDLLAEELRLAQQYLSDITGAFSSDDLLGEIFSKFCIGK
jgi:tRNA modification GTPase